MIAVVGIAVLFGWHFDIELLRAGLPGRTPVNPVTALAFLSAACADYHQASGRPDSAVVRWLAVIAASLVIALGIIALTGYFVGHNLRVDQVLFGAQLAGNRVAPNTGFALLRLTSRYGCSTQRVACGAGLNKWWRCFQLGSPSFRCSVMRIARRACTESANCNTAT